MKYMDGFYKRLTRYNRLKTELTAYKGDNWEERLKEIDKHIFWDKTMMAADGSWSDFYV